MAAGRVVGDTVFNQNWHDILNLNRKKIIFAIIVFFIIGFSLGVGIGYGKCFEDVKMTAVNLLSNPDAIDSIIEGLNRLQGKTTEEIPDNFTWNLTQNIY